MAHIVSDIWPVIECSLFPSIELALQEELNDGHKRVIAALELVRIEEHVPLASWQMRGRPRSRRSFIARAFVAKAVLGILLTKRLREALLSDRSLRRICGFQRQSDVPSESTLSRAFGEFAKAELGRRVHEALAHKHVGDRVVMHVCRDSTAIAAREKPAPRVKEPKAPKKRGRKGKNDPPRELKRLEKQREQTPEEAFAEIPTVCAKGCKSDTHGNPHYWTGYKEHIDWTDNGFPLTVRITSASVHDSQIAIPMAKYTANKHTILYELMDAAYDAIHIHEAIRELGHVPIIALNPRNAKMPPLDAATERRYQVRSAAERGNSRLKDEFGCRNIRVRGAAKVHQHVMFGVLALCADVLIKMAVGST
jgi:IS5 family transposase